METFTLRLTKINKPITFEEYKKTYQGSDMSNMQSPETASYFVMADEFSSNKSDVETIGYLTLALDYFIKKSQIK